MYLPNKNLSLEFEVYLKEEQKVSGKTLRNYRADLSHFVAWSAKHLSSQGFKVEDIETLIPHFTGQLIANYKGYHLENQIPDSTINRRLSTLRNFGRFMTKAGIGPNPTDLISNVKAEVGWEQHSAFLLEEFEKHLKKEGISSITLKNYASDIRQFLAWVSNN